MSSVAEKIEEIIDKNVVVVFSKSYCPYCVQAVKTLKSIGQSPVVIELDQVDGGDEQHAYLKQKTGQNTVPVIYIKQKFIGGNSDLQALNSNGKLQSFLWSSSLPD